MNELYNENNFERSKCKKLEAKVRLVEERCKFLEVRRKEIEDKINGNNMPIRNKEYNMKGVNFKQTRIKLSHSRLFYMQTFFH